MTICLLICILKKNKVLLPPKQTTVTTHFSNRKVDFVCHALQVIGITVEPLQVEELGSEVLSLHDMYNPGNAALEINWREFLPLVNRWLPNRKLHKMLNNVTRRRSALVRALISQERELLSSGKVPF